MLQILLESLLTNDFIEERKKHDVNHMDTIQW